MANLLRILHNIIARLESADFNESEADFILDRLEWVIGVIIRLVEDNTIVTDNILAPLQRAREIVQEAMELERQRSISHIAVSLTGNAGRPSYDIPLVQLRYLIENGFTITDISLILGVSARTVRRRLQRFGLSVRAMYSTMSDHDLEEVIRSILNDFPNCGYRRMDGFLRAKGLRIQNQRIRSCVKRVDPDGVLLRSIEINVIKRRGYNVISPMALWHVDGYHKLIR